MGIKTAKRTNRATKVAYWADIQRIYYAAHLTAFIHNWATIILSILIPSALTVFQFLAALNRASKNGYIGCAVAYSLLAPRIAHATGRKCSVRTLERGIAALKRLGLVDLTWYTLPDQTVHNGEHDHVICGTGRVETDDGWKSLQIRIITLTDRAIALWDRRTCKKGCDYIPHFAQFLTPAKMADSPQDDLIDKSIKLDQQSSEHGSSRTTRKTMSDYEPSTKQNVSHRPRGLEGQPTSSSSSIDEQTTSSSNVEHLSSTVAQTIGDTAPSHSMPQESIEQTGLADNSGYTSNLSGMSGKQTTSGPDDYVDTGDEQLDTDPCRPESSDSVNPTRPPKRKCPDVGRPRGVSHTAPKIPKNAPNKTSWAVARVYLLAELHRALTRFSRGEADTIYERAKIELSRVYPARFCCIDWAYWVGRFATMLPQQRKYHMYRDILPVLKAHIAVIPKEPRRYAEHKNTSVVRDELAPFLKKLASRFLDEK